MRLNDIIGVGVKNSKGTHCDLACRVTDINKKAQLVDAMVINGGYLITITPSGVVTHGPGESILNPVQEVVYEGIVPIGKRGYADACEYINDELSKSFLTRTINSMRYRWYEFTDRLRLSIKAFKYAWNTREDIVESCVAIDDDIPF